MRIVVASAAIAAMLSFVAVSKLEQAPVTAAPNVATPLELHMRANPHGVPADAPVE